MHAFVLPPRSAVYPASSISILAFPRVSLPPLSYTRPILSVSGLTALFPRFRLSDPSYNVILGLLDPPDLTLTRCTYSR